MIISNINILKLKIIYIMIEVHYDDYEEDMDKNGTNGDNKQNNVKAG